MRRLSLLTSSLSVRPIRRHLARFRRRLARNDRGVAAVEFAFIAPIMLTMLVGIVDVSNAVSINWRMSQLNRTLADLTSQAKTLTTAESQQIFQAAAATMSPYTGPTPFMSIYNVTINATGVATVCWIFSSYGSNVLGLSPGSPVTLPNSGMAVPKSSLIMTAAKLNYAGLITPSFDMDAKPLFFRPRAGSILGPNSIEQVGQVLNTVGNPIYGC